MTEPQDHSGNADKDTAKRRDEALGRALTTPPTQHKPASEKLAKPKRQRGDKSEQGG